MALLLSAGAFAHPDLDAPSTGGIRPSSAVTVPGSLNASSAHSGSDAEDESAAPLNARGEVLPTVPRDLNEQVVEIPVGEIADGDMTLETTIFKPSGNGPFPLIVFNHGKEHGDPREQARSRPLAFAREFVRRGYVVVAPNRRGFARSGGTYVDNTCDVATNGLAQARDVAATVAYMSRQPYVDTAHIVVAGVSHGGLTTIAYGQTPQPGVRGLLNFAGGLRQAACVNWQTDLSHAFGAYGAKVRVPSLWLYGDNDSFWSPQLASRMYDAFVRHGGHAKFVDIGRYKDDAHRIVADRDGVPVWWPSAAAFLAQVGMPTSVRYWIADPVLPRGSGFATIDAIDAVPFVDDTGRAGYQTFLQQYPTRAFAVSDNGAWSWAAGGDDAMSLALSSCAKRSTAPCHLYAVNDNVVWNEH
ncbi:dipeptidyl aminopeptidase [Pandoraea terrae]|uniref:Dipeptidyl aminopeptidase n=1 Tax=Pandoraea terrae TaxID=1537710 RepID=A0A5E4U7C9_9BURK|nr:CocE/NonD family hydrolase [Pandoraea terrae]VVD94119.1 dipeptidyl aminopeptidase [Pandoraea terrae]